ncbi:phospholipid carrier-dependent glycosyltransferase [Chloroflexota bacterium]
MEIVKRLWYHEYFWLCLLVLASLAMHFSIINQPAEPLFDEQHYVPDARSIVQGSGTSRLEHPPLGKLFIVSGISLFGDTPLGWRFFSILFGAVCIVLFYLICRQLKIPRRASFLATFLLALENLSFVQASVAILDVFSLAFMLASFWLYLRGKYLLSGVAVGLGTLAKLTGTLALPVMFLHWFFRRGVAPRRFIITMLLAPLSFLLLMPLFDFIVSRQWLNPIDRVMTMLSLSGSLTFSATTHGSASHPWEWILRPEIMAYWYEPHYIAAISFTILALVIPSVLYMTYYAVKGSEPHLFGISWFAGTYLIWIPLSLISDRISFVYYFYPTVGAICIGLGLGFSQLMTLCEARKTARRVVKTIIAGYLLLHVVIFTLLSPVFNWWSIPFFP